MYWLVSVGKLELMFAEELNNNGIWNLHYTLVQKFMLRKLTDCFHIKIRSPTSNLYSNKNFFATLSSFWRGYKVVVPINPQEYMLNHLIIVLISRKVQKKFQQNPRHPAILLRAWRSAKPEIWIRKQNFNISCNGWCSHKSKGTTYSN